MLSGTVVALMFIDVSNLRLPVETIIFSLHKIVPNYLYCCDGNMVMSIQICCRGNFIGHCWRRGRCVERLLAGRDGVLCASCFHGHPQFYHPPPPPMSR